MLKLSTACWLMAREASTRTKIADVHARNIPVVTSGETFEVAVVHGALPEFLDLCVEFGVARIECSEDCVPRHLSPQEVIKMINERGMEVQFGIRRNRGRAMTLRSWKGFVGRGQIWLDAGAKQVIVETTGGEGSADEAGLFQSALTDRLATVFGLDTLIFQASSRASQFAILDQFGPRAQLSNVRLDEVLRVEGYRRGLNSDPFARSNLHF